MVVGWPAEARRSATACPAPPGSTTRRYRRPTPADIDATSPSASGAAASAIWPWSAEMAALWAEHGITSLAQFYTSKIKYVLVLGVAVHVLGLNRFLTANGLDLTSLLAFAAVMGFGGAFISLLISKPMAKWSTRAAGHQ
jgi:Zn-dependent protease with chaperone function